MYKRGAFFLLQLFWLLGGAPSLVGDENIFGAVKSVVTPQKEGQEISLRMGDLVALLYPEDTTFVRGIEITISNPANIEQFRDDFAMTLFKNVAPEITDERRSYHGSQILSRVMPVYDRFKILIPLKSGHRLSQDATTVLTATAKEPWHFPLIFTIEPVSKGLPDSAYFLDFKVSIRLLFKEEGTISITLANKEEISSEDVTVLIDGKKVPWPAEVYQLPVGTYTVEILKEGYQHYQSVVTLTPGNHIDLEATIFEAVTGVNIEGYPGIEFSIDGEDFVLSSQKLFVPLEAGEHTIRLTVGGQLLSQKFTLTEGAEVSILLFFDITIQNS